MKESLPGSVLLFVLPAFSNNFLLGFLIALFLTGTIGVQLPKIAASNVSTPAMESGLQEGDEIRFIKIGNAKGRTVHSYSELAMYMELHKEEVQEGEVSLTVLRDGEKLSFQFPAYKDPSTGLYRMGVALSSERVKFQNPLKTIEYSFYELAFNARVVIDSLALISKGKVSRQEVMGSGGYGCGYRRKCFQLQPIRIFRNATGFTKLKYDVERKFGGNEPFAYSRPGWRTTSVHSFGNAGKKEA